MLPYTDLQLGLNGLSAKLGDFIYLISNTNSFLLKKCLNILTVKMVCI